MKTISKIGICMVLISLSFNFIETAFFGFNMKPMSHPEEICDTICKLLLNSGIILTVLGAILKESVYSKTTTVNSSTDKALSRILHYSFDPIHWEYKNLTTAEKEALSPSEFQSLKDKYRNLNN